MRRRREVRTLLVLLGIGAVLVVIYATGRGNVRKTGPRHDTGAGLHALLTAFVIYAQNNHDAFPPPSQASLLLIKAGIVGPQLFASPPAAPGEPAFYAVLPPPGRGHWANSFQESRPLLYANPAGGTYTAVGYTEGHVEVVAISDLEGMIKASGGSVQAVR